MNAFRKVIESLFTSQIDYLSAIKSRYQHEIINIFYILLKFKIIINKYNFKT